MVGYLHPVVGVLGGTPIISEPTPRGQHHDRWMVTVLTRNYLTGPRSSAYLHGI